MVDIIDLAAGVTQLDQHLRRRHQVLRVEHALGQRNILLEPLVQFVTADRAEVVTAVVEEEPLDQQLRIVDVGRVARTHAAVDLLQRVLLVADLVLAHAADQVVVAVGDISELDLLDPGIDQLLQVVFSQLYELIDHHDVVIAGDVVDRVEAGEILLLQQLRNRVLPDLVALRQDIAVGRIADRAQEGRDVELPAAAATVEVDENEVVDVEHIGHADGCGFLTGRQVGGARVVVLDAVVSSGRLDELQHRLELADHDHVAVDPLQVVLGEMLGLELVLDRLVVLVDGNRRERDLARFPHLRRIDILRLRHNT